MIGANTGSSERWKPKPFSVSIYKHISIYFSISQLKFIQIGIYSPLYHSLMFFHRTQKRRRSEEWPRCSFHIASTWGVEKNNKKKSQNHQTKIPFGLVLKIFCSHLINERTRTKCKYFFFFKERKKRLVTAQKTLCKNFSFCVKHQDLIGL